MRKVHLGLTHCALLLLLMYKDARFGNSNTNGVSNGFLTGF